MYTNAYIQTSHPMVEASAIWINPNLISSEGLPKSWSHYLRASGSHQVSIIRHVEMVVVNSGNQISQMREVTHIEFQR